MELLPKVPSRLIRIALADLKKVEESPYMYIDMNYWLHPRSLSCLAGAVMVFSLGAGTNIDSYGVQPSNFGEDADALRALDNLRQGQVGIMFRFLGLNRDTGRKYDWCVTPYETSPEEFKEELEKIADILEADGY